MTRISQSAAAEQRDDAPTSAGGDHIDIERLVRDGVLTRDEARALEHSQQSDSGGAARMEALPETRGSGEDKDAVKEVAVKHKRHWVRVTRVCNQRCTFCLDSMNQDGTMIDTDSLKAYIALGRKMGRERLILSGGEASVHPDYIELIRYGREVGYEWIQTITNGMMFSYKKFARKCADAGLNEATVSMHGHTAYLQDRLTGTPGAFVTGVKGMQNLIATGKVVVNVDVVINKQNYKHLPEIIEYYYNLSIREFDLLHIIPFGRGFDEHRHSLFFDLNDAVPYFRRAFEWANKPGVYLWTNRLPVPYLEDFERLIQDPHKLTYEFDGGRHNFESFLKRGLKPDCWGERCDYCFLDGPCRSTMFPYRGHLEARTFPVVKLDSQTVWPSPQAQAVFEAQQPKRVVLTARDTADASHALDSLPFGDAPVSLQLDAGAEPESLPARVDRLVISSVDDAARYLVGTDRVTTEVEVQLDRKLASWLLARPSTVKSWGNRLILTLQDHEYLSGSQQTDPAPESLRKLAGLGARLKNVPACVAGGESVPHDHFRLDAELLDRGGDLDLDRYVHHYIEREYYAKSLRCNRCALSDDCRGLHINYLRNHGFKILRPLDEDGQELADAGSFEDITQVLKEATADRDRRERKRIVGMHQPAKSVRVALGKTSLSDRKSAVKAEN
ncbi:MAG: radical SAM protein [Myxococcales bacterium]|nr:radical SAM protein [Myxococcales bacterium]